MHRIADGDVTGLLRLAAEGDNVAKEELYELIYDDLRDAARRVLRRGGRGDFQTTALVNEALLRFEPEQAIAKVSKNRRVFFSVAIRAMQQAMIDQHRRRKREQLIPDGFDPIDDAIADIESQIGCDFEALSLALQILKTESQRQHSVVTHRFFGGFTIRETAELLDVSEATVERDWRLARAKLAHRLRNDRVD